MRAAKTAAIALLGLMVLGSLPVAQASSPSLEWWGPTEVGKGFHIRLPVTVTNQHPVELTNAPAKLEVDLGQALHAAGWVSAPGGDREILQAFRLAMQSVRVVAMTNLNPQLPGTIDGRLRLVNPELPGGDLGRYEVPSMAFAGYLERPQADAFDSQTNPLVTVVWEVAGTLQPGEKRFFMVYFDTPHNLDHAAPDYQGSVAGSHLQGLHWSGPGLELVGLPKAGTGGTNTLTVLALHPGTRVSAYGSTPGGQWNLLKPPQGFPPNPASMQAGEAQEIYAGAGASALIRILSDKPVLAWGVGTGFVPALDGGMAGHSFVFAKTQARDDVIHFINTGGKPTSITVTPLGGGGPPLTFTMSDDQNPLPYTIGARSGAWGAPGSGCVLLNPSQPSPLLPGMGLYQAAVTTGGPVLLQHGVNYGLSQVPTRQGAPAGPEVWSATGWTNRQFFQPRFGGSTCSNDDKLGGWFASSLDGPATARVSSPETGVSVDPPGNTQFPSPPPRTVPEAPRIAGRHPAPLLDRPLQIHSDGQNLVAFVGLHPAPRASGPLPQIHGPLGGAEGGRQFVGVGPTVVFAPYANTEVTARLEASTSGMVTQVVRLAANTSHLFTDLAPNDWIYGVHLSANRPIIAYPMGVTPGTLAAVPTYLDAQAGLGEFRGYLVSLSSPTGLDPVTGSTTPGVPITYLLEVTNLGRSAGGGNLADTISLSVPPASPGWTVQLDRSEVTLASGQAETVRLTVRPDSSLPSGSLGVFPVTATSRGNPNMRDTLGTVTYVQRSFDVGVWFEVPGQPKALTKSSEAGKAVDFPLVVKNRGSVADIIRVTATPPAPGWKTLLLQEGGEARDFPLHPDGSARFILRVTPPDGANDGLLTTQVTAQSQSSQAVLDRAVATSKLRAPSLLQLEVPPGNLHLFPGQAADFNLTLKNRGLGSAEVDMEAAVDRLPGWSASPPYVAGADGVPVNLTRISVAPGESFPFKIRIHAPANAPADQAIGLRITARNRETAESVEEFLVTVVRPLHRLEVSLPSLPIRPAFDANRTSLQVRLTNHGNLDEHLEWVVENQPTGWALEAPSSILVARNGTQQVTLALGIPQGQPVGQYNLTAAWVSRDGNRTVVRLPVAIGVVSSARSADGMGILAQPGRPVRIEVPVHNDGNVPLKVTVEGLAGAPWSLVPGEGPLRLLPGANRTVTVGWQVPIEAPDGASSHSARLVFVPESGVPFVREVRATLDVGRADLVPMQFRAYAGPAGTLVEGRIANLGQRPAQEFEVHLRSGQEVVEAVVFQELQPGANATVRLLLPHAKAGSPAVVVDAANAVAESDESNNALSVEVTPATVGTPASGFALLLLACAAVAWVAQRRRWG